MIDQDSEAKEIEGDFGCLEDKDHTTYLDEVVGEVLVPLPKLPSCFRLNIILIEPIMLPSISRRMLSGGHQ